MGAVGEGGMRGERLEERYKRRREKEERKKQCRMKLDVKKKR